MRVWRGSSDSGEGGGGVQGIEIEAQDEAQDVDGMVEEAAKGKYNQDGMLEDESEEDELESSGSDTDGEEESEEEEAEEWEGGDEGDLPQARCARCLLASRPAGISLRVGLQPVPGRIALVGASRINA